MTDWDEARLRRGRNDQSRQGHQCSETTPTGESRFHISPPRGLELGSLVSGSKGLVHWTSETWWEWSEIAGSAQPYGLAPAIGDSCLLLGYWPSGNSLQLHKYLQVNICSVQKGSYIWNSFYINFPKTEFCACAVCYRDAVLAKITVYPPPAPNIGHIPPHFVFSRISNDFSGKGIDYYSGLYKYY